MISAGDESILIHNLKWGLSVNRKNLCAVELYHCLSFKKQEDDLLAYRYKVSLEIPRKGILPEFDLFGELGLGNTESLRGNVNVLGAVHVREIDKRQGNNIVVETLSGKLSVKGLTWT